MAVIREAMIGDGAVRMTDPAVGQVGMVVAVFVHGERRSGTRAEQFLVGRVLRHMAGRPGTTNMAVQANDVIGGGHDHVQVVRNQQNAAAIYVADGFDQFVEGDLAGKIHALDRFVQDQQIGAAGNRARQHDTLELAARQVPHLGPLEPFNACRPHGVFGVAFRQPAGQVHEAFDPQGQGPIDGDLLRHIADGQPGAPLGPALVGFQDAERHLGGGRLARAVGADEGDDPPSLDRHVHIADQPMASTVNTRVRERYQWGGGVRHVSHPKRTLQSIRPIRSHSNQTLNAVMARVIS